MALVGAIGHQADGGQPEQRSSAQPRAAVEAILDLLSLHQIVALGEGPHNNQQGHAFRLSLIRQPRFAEIVDDVVVEAGNARYQPLMDRYISGEDVPYQTLRRVWEDTTVPGTVWDKPMYHELYAAIRELNRARSSTRRLRVLLGDPPIDWALIRSAEQLNQFFPQRSRHAAAVIQREVLSKNRSALVIYGDGHLQGRGMPDSNSLLNVLERTPGLHVFNISNSFADLRKLQSGVEKWSVPSLVMVKGTNIGAQPYAAFYPIPAAAGWNLLRMEQQFDAVLYLGGPAALSMNPLPKSLCDDRTYMKMRLGRLALSASDVNRDPGVGLRKHFGRPT